MRARTYLMLSVSPRAILGTVVPGSNYAEFQERRVVMVAPDA